VSEKCVTLEDDGAIQNGRPRKTWKEVVDKDMDDLHLKPSYAMDHSKWMKMITGIAATVIVIAMNS